MPSEKKEELVGQGSSMECPRPLCSPGTPSPACHGLSPLQYVSLYLMLERSSNTFLWKRKLHDCGRGGGEEALQP